jgi:hypothetical protein
MRADPTGWYKVKAFSSMKRSSWSSVMESMLLLL